MNINLTTELLRNLVAIVDAGSMSKASAQVNITQSALSLQMKRLCDLVGRPVFQRHHRGVTLTPAGKTLLAYAREMIELNDRAISAIMDSTVADPIRIGVPDSGGLLLTRVLPQIARALPGAQIHVGVGTTSELLNQLSGGLYDIVVCPGEPTDRASIATAQMHWVGDPKLRDEPQLPLVVLRKPCVYRDAAIASLEAAGRDYRIVLEAPTHFVMQAAALGGVGVTCRSGPMFLSNLPHLGDLGAPLPRLAICLHTTSVPSPSVHKVARLIRSEILQVVRGGPHSQPVTPMTDRAA